ncbi:MAG: regulatory protein GemA [Pseudomonadota bacterium]
MTTDQYRRREIGLIQMAKQFFANRDGMTDDDYRAVLREVTGKTSSTQLDAAGRDKLLRHFKTKGFVVLPKPGTNKAATLREPQEKKLLAMWWALADVNAVTRPLSAEACHQAVEGWCRRQLAEHPLGPLDALRFATGEQMNVLVESMKQWGGRVDADIH